MCIIIDANFANLLVHSNEDIRKDMRPIMNWIKHNGRIVTGGKLTRELSGCSGKFQELLNMLTQNGLVKIVNNKKVNVEADNLKSECRSNDEHIIALARVSGARLLCSQDRKLSQDFTNRDLLISPRGKVYKERRHRHLLASVRCRF